MATMNALLIINFVDVSITTTLGIPERLRKCFLRLLDRLARPPYLAASWGEFSTWLEFHF